MTSLHLTQTLPSQLIMLMPKLNTWSTPLLGATALALSLGAVAPAAEAFTLNATGGSWSNPKGGDFIQYQTVAGENQIRWGYPATWVPTWEEWSGLSWGRGHGTRSRSDL
ncbi:MAG: hypothetical protein ACPGVO_21505 [Spirulinaceae cyanobacterium]